MEPQVLTLRKTGGLMPPLTEWLCLGCRNVVFFYARLCKALQRGPQVDLPGQEDVAWFWPLYYSSSMHFAPPGPCCRTGTSAHAHHPWTSIWGCLCTPQLQLTRLHVVALQKSQAPALVDLSVPSANDVSLSIICSNTGLTL